MPSPEPDLRRGVAAALTAYLWWGLSPLFWKQLGDVDAIDTVGWRILWTAVVAAAVIVATGRVHAMRSMAADATARAAAMVSGLLLATNWAVYVWAVGDERVVEASLGYFMNPLVSVFLGVVVLRESLRRAQWAAVALAATGVAWLTFAVGSLPWVSLALAGTFALYGLVRKVAPAGPIIGLGMEMAVLAIPAAMLLLLRSQVGDVDLVGSGPTMALLATTGLITAVPLLAFASAARRIPLSIVGLLQYLTPTLQFLIGRFVYDEPFDSRQLIGYAIIWSGLAVFAVDAARSARTTHRPVDVGLAPVASPDRPEERLQP